MQALGVKYWNECRPYLAGEREQFNFSRELGLEWRSISLASITNYSQLRILHTQNVAASYIIVCRAFKFVSFLSL